MTATRKGLAAIMVGGLIVTLGLAFLVSPLASSSPDGLEKVATDEGFIDTAEDHASRRQPVGGVRRRRRGGRVAQHRSCRHRRRRDHVRHRAPAVRDLPRPSPESRRSIADAGVGPGRLSSKLVSGSHAHALYFHGHSAVHRLAPETKLVAQFLFVLDRRGHPSGGVLGLRALRGAGAPRRSVGVESRRRSYCAASRSRSRSSPSRSSCRSSARANASTCSVLSLSVEGLWGAWNILAKGTIGVLASSSAGGDHDDGGVPHRVRPAACAEGVHVDRLVHGALHGRDRRRHAPHADRPPVARVRRSVDLADEGDREVAQGRSSSGRTSAASGSTSRCSRAGTRARCRRWARCTPRPGSGSRRRSCRSWRCRSARSRGATGMTETIEPVTGPALEVKDLAFAYPGGTQALFGVDLAIGTGERVALLGPNGAGQDHARAAPERDARGAGRIGARRGAAGREGAPPGGAPPGRASCSRIPTINSSCPRSATTSRSGQRTSAFAATSSTSGSYRRSRRSAWKPSPTARPIT